MPDPKSDTPRNGDRGGLRALLEEQAAEEAKRGDGQGSATPAGSAGGPGHDGPSVYAYEVRLTDGSVYTAPHESLPDVVYPAWTQARTSDGIVAFFDGQAFAARAITRLAIVPWEGRER